MPMLWGVDNGFLLARVRVVLNVTRNQMYHLLLLYIAVAIVTQIRLLGFPNRTGELRITIGSIASQWKADLRCPNL